MINTELFQDSVMVTATCDQCNHTVPLELTCPALSGWNLYDARQVTVHNMQVLAHLTKGLCDHCRKAPPTPAS